MKINMKKQNKLNIRLASLSLLIAASIASSNSMASVAEVAALFPVSIPAKVGSVSGAKFVGIPVARPSVYEGSVTTLVPASSSSASTLIPDTGLDELTVDALGIASVGTGRISDEVFATEDNQYVIEFTTGPNIGLVKTVSAVGVDGITVVGGMKSSLAVGTTYILRKDWTLGSLFGNDATSVAASGLKTGLASSADHVGVVRNAKLELFYFNGSWKTTGTTVAGTAYEHVRVPLSGGFYFKRNTAAATTLYMTGVYRPHRLQALLEGVSGSLHTVSTPNFNETTLAATGLHRYVKSNTAVGSADEVRLVGANGSIKTYFNAGSGSGYTSGFWNGTSAAAPAWRESTSGFAPGSANTLVIPAGTAVLLKKNGADSRLIGIDPDYTK